MKKLLNIIAMLFIATIAFAGLEWHPTNFDEYYIYSVDRDAFLNDSNRYDSLPTTKWLYIGTPDDYELETTGCEDYTRNGFRLTFQDWKIVITNTAYGHLFHYGSSGTYVRDSLYNGGRIGIYHKDNNGETWSAIANKDSLVVVQGEEEPHFVLINTKYIGTPIASNIEYIWDNNTETTNNSFAYYNLQGIKVNALPMTKGIYIKKNTTTGEVKLINIK